MEAVLGKIVEAIVEPVIQLVVVRVGFVFQYKKRLKNLEIEIKNLEEQKKKIKKEVDEAIIRGEEVDEPVSIWLAEVEKRVQKIQDDNTINENRQCFKLSCPDYIPRYRMSKEAEIKIQEIKNLTQSGNFTKKNEESGLKICTPQAVPDTIVGKIVEPVIQLVVVHVGILFQYKKKLRNLEDEIEKLERQKTKIEEEVGEDITVAVSEWLAEVEKIVQKIKNDNTMNENRQCFKFSCPDYISRYRMSKDAEKKMEEVKILIQEGNFSKVANPKPFAPELQFPSSSANYAKFKSRKPVFENIMAALQDSNVKMIGVYGTGGVGKTTMVEEIGKLVKNGLFDEVVVAVVSQDANVSNIQGQLADRLNLELQGETHEVGKASKLWNRLSNGKKNLIILDDMWQNLDLKRIGIPIIDGNNCCKVVITSRIRGVLEEMHVDRYVPMKVLSEKEAWALFKTKVGNFVNSPELDDIAVAVCKECGGLPVAILAVAAALKDKKNYVWEDVLEQFKDSMLKNTAEIDPKVYASLKSSYDRLEYSDAKSCFLLCCFFPKDTNISMEVLARHCIARSLLGENTNTLIRASRRVLTMVNILKDACLLFEGEDENFVKMHDVIRDVALSIAKDDGKEILVEHGVIEWPEKDTCESYSAISLRFNNTLELPDDLVCPQLHTLTILLEQHISPLLNVPDRFFSGMEKLTILELNRICMLPPLSLANLVNLRMLWLNDCELGDIAILKDLNNNLEILSLRGSNIEVLPSEIGQLTRLRLLDLGNCKKLREIPQGVISNLSLLEELYILNEFGYREERSKVNLDELGKLTQLTTLQIHIPNVMLLPKDFCFVNLIRYKISVGKKYDFLGAYSKSCKLAGVSLMDKFIVLLLRAEELHLEKIEGLQEVLHDRGGAGSLMERHGLNPSGFFNNLIELTVGDCRLEYLFSLSCARGFPRLQRLEIFDCETMEAIVGIEEEKYEDELSSQVINFSQLEYLSLENLPKLISFYPKVEKMTTSEGNSSTQAQSLFNEKVAFPVLENLKITKVPNITEIWDKQLLTVLENESKSFCQLKEMEVNNCEKLVNVVWPNMHPQLQNLEKLNVYGCPNMEVIVWEKENEKEPTSEDIIVFTQLTTLCLQNLTKLKSFYSWPTRSKSQPLFNHQVAFPALEELLISGVPNITEILGNQFPSKQKVNCFEKLMNVVQSNMLPRLQNLRKLSKNAKEKAMAQEKKRNDDVIVFPRLRTVRVDSLQNLETFCKTRRSETQTLFNHQIACPQLRVLSIGWLPNITDVWDTKLLPTGSFCQLTEVRIDGCDKLVNVILSNMVPRLQNLTELSVQYCPMVEEILSEKGEEKADAEAKENIILFPQLKTLELGSLENLKSFCTSKLAAQHFFKHPAAFAALEELHICNLPNITEIWGKQLLPVPKTGARSFEKLAVVNATWCDKLVNVIPSSMLPWLKNLETMYVKGCPEMEVIVSNKANATVNGDIICFPELSSLSIDKLYNLKSFCSSSTSLEAQPLFNDQVVFPILEDLFINRVQNITKIWDKLHSRELFCFLKRMMIEDCEKLVNVVPSYMLPQLQNLEVLNVYGCPKMLAIVSEEERKEKDVNENTILFPELTTLNLKSLDNLKTFYTQPFLNHQVALPKLKNPCLDQYLQQLFLKGKECAIMNENDDKEIEQDKHRLLKGKECEIMNEIDAKEIEQDKRRRLKGKEFRNYE